MESRGAVGRYQVLREVARGGMGVVYQARGPDGRTVALKVLAAARMTSHTHRERFLREVQALVRIRHPNVVKLLDAGLLDPGGVPFLALEWVEGESLQQRLDRAGPLAAREAALIVRQVAAALDHCHAMNVLHRDLKPANVMLGGARRAEPLPLLTDFGLARDLIAELDATRLSASGVFLGTPGYLSPEQARGERDAVGPRSDVFGLGALLFALLTGRPPFEGDTVSTLLARLDRPAPAPSSVRPGVPRALDAVCARALALDPAGRHPSAAAVAEELAAWQAQAPRERPSRMAWGAAIGMVAVATGVVAWLGLQPDATPVSTSTNESGADATELVAQAREAWHANQLLRTLDLADALLAARVPGAHGLRAQVHMVREERELARAQAEKAAASADPAERALGLAIDALARGDPRAAATALDAELSARPDQPDALVWRGAARHLLGDSDGARADFDRALALAPRFVLALVFRADLLAASDPQRALADLGLALELDPRAPHARRSRAALRHQTGDTRGELEDLTLALELDPKDAAAWNDRAAAREELGDAAGALLDYDRAIELAPDAVGHLNRGQCRRKKGDAAGALADLDRAVQLDPGLARAWGARASLRQLLGDDAGALADWDRCLALTPDDTLALNNRALSRQSTGDRAGAMADYDRVVALAPGHPAGWANRGRLRLQLGDPAGALGDLERALQLDLPEVARDEVLRNLERARASLR